ncbi:MAG TPA: tetratricopeptide repeat protein, partial [Myxococcota bacterium]
AARASGLAVDTFLRGATLNDLVERDVSGADIDGDVVMLLRSPAWAKAWPEALVREHDEGGVIMLGRESRDGRVSPIRRAADDDEHRFAFLEREARRQLPFLQVAGHAFILDDGSARVITFIGDRAATLLLDGALLRGLWEQLGPVPDAVDVCTITENVVIVSTLHAPALLLEEARHRAVRLEADLFDDGADPLDINQRLLLPDHGAGVFSLTLVPDEFFQLGDQADEIGDFGRAHGEHLRGLAYEALGLIDKAVRSFEKAARARVDDGHIHFALGRALSAQHEHERAVAVLTRAIIHLDDNADAHNALGVALYKTGSVTPARAAFLKAVHLAPDEVSFLVNLARTCCDEELFTEAKTVLEHALRMEPSSAEAHASMAVLLHRTGERQRALHHARVALAEHPDDDTVQELLRMLG